MPGHGVLGHMAFEGIAWLAAVVAGWRVRRVWLDGVVLPLPARSYPVYMAIVWVGAIAGAIVLGTINLALAGIESGGRSILGALLGGVVTAEAYKRLRGVRGSTGVVFVVPLALGIAIGRIGCFAGGLEDFTYGTPTTLPWGVDFGDGVARHPVQLYESAAMLGFLALFAPQLRRRQEVVLRCGFYLFTGWYAAQRFVWEFLKPYPDVLGQLNLCQLGCLALFVYSLTMILVTRVPAHARA